MKYSTLVLLLIPLVVNADARCNQDIGTAHYPYDLVDTDNEYKFDSDVGLKEVSGRGAVACYAKREFKNVPHLAAPEGVSLSSGGNSGNCVMVNDEGAETETPWWNVYIKSDCKNRVNEDPNWARCDVSYELICARFSVRIEH